MRFDLASGRFVECEIGAGEAAVLGGDKSLSWQEFRRSVSRWVAEARGAGIGTDVPVVIYGHKEAEFVVAMVGCLELGAPFIPVDEIYPEDRLQRIAAIAQAPVIYRASESVFRKLGYPTTPMREKGLAYVMFTSGSTGEPKGVQIGRESLMSLVEWMHDCFALGERPVYMNQAPFSFDLSMYEFFSFLHEGGTIVLNPRKVVADTESYYSRLKREKVTTWISTPSFAHQQLLNKQFSQQYLQGIRTFLFCGEVLPVNLVRRLRERFPDARIINTYGPTEATVATTWVVIDDRILAKYDPLPVGRAKPGSIVRVDAGDGELVILGTHVMRGYLNRDDLNSEKLFSEGGQRGFRTGDFGSMREDGLIFCRGRRDDQIKLNGYRIELLEVDKALQQLPGIVRSAVVPLHKPDGSVGRLVGCVIAEGGADPLADGRLKDWKERLAKQVPHYMVPAELRVMHDFPVSNNGKVDRKALEQSYLNASRSR
jgi:D-alanine--poly(phosphoribitol) ligase subunit 1